jgi:hypothetical protein
VDVVLGQVRFDFDDCEAAIAWYGVTSKSQLNCHTTRLRNSPCSLLSWGLACRHDVVD